MKKKHEPKPEKPKRDDVPRIVGNEWINGRPFIIWQMPDGTTKGEKTFGRIKKTDKK